MQWEQGMVALSGENLAYVLHLYTPYEFALGGATATFKPEVIRTDLQRRVEWRNAGPNAPLFATEYSVMRGQPSEQRVAWLRAVHDRFLEHEVSATWFNYKSEAGAYINAGAMLGLRGQFLDRDQQIVTTNGGWAWASDAVQTVAEANGFGPLFERFFLDLSSTQSSEMDSAPLIDELRRLQIGDG